MKKGTNTNAKKLQAKVAKVFEEWKAKYKKEQIEYYEKQVSMANDAGRKAGSKATFDWCIQELRTLWMTADKYAKLEGSSPEQIEFWSARRNQHLCAISFLQGCYQEQIKLEDKKIDLEEAIRSDNKNYFMAMEYTQRPDGKWVHGWKKVYHNV